MPAPSLAKATTRSRSSFSLYRSYSHDLITKRQGAGYETDAEFYDLDGSIYLHVEAKASGPQTDKLARRVREHGDSPNCPSRRPRRSSTSSTSRLGTCGSLDRGRSIHLGTCSR